MKNIFLLLILFITLSCNNNKTNKSEANKDSDNSYVAFSDIFLQKNNLKQTYLCAEDLFNVKKITEFGIILNKSQKKDLLTGIINFPLDEYNAIFAKIAQISDSIVSVYFLIQYSDIESLYIINYFQPNKIVNYLSSGQIEGSDLIVQEENKEVYYNLLNYFLFENNNNIVLTKKYEETTHFLDTDTQNITYKDSVAKHYNINCQGKFILLKTDSISSGNKFTF